MPSPERDETKQAEDEQKMNWTTKCSQKGRIYLAQKAIRLELPLSFSSDVPKNKHSDRLISQFGTLDSNGTQWLNSSSLDVVRAEP